MKAKTNITRICLPFIALLILLALNFCFSARYDVLESIYKLSRRYEQWELDELITLSLSLVLYLIVFSLVQWKKAIDRERSLKKALDEIRRLKEILPICSYCKKIRNDDGIWQEIDQYISSNTDTRFSHGICPDCEIKYFSEDDISSDCQ